MRTVRRIHNRDGLLDMCEEKYLIKTMTGRAVLARRVLEPGVIAEPRGPLIVPQEGRKKLAKLSEQSRHFAQFHLGNGPLCPFAAG